MAQANSTRASRPEKPYRDFPLTWHPGGYWCKKINGRLHYFGDRNGDWQTALDEFQRVRDDLYAGRLPRANADGATVRYLANHFLTDREHRLQAGELTRASFDDYKATCALLIKHLGADRLVSDLRPDDFLDLRKFMAKKWGPVTLAGEIGRVRVICNYAWQAELIDKPLRFGPTFKRPSKKVLRQHRQSKGKKFLDAATIRDILKKASTQMNAMVLLACNAGLGNRDCAKLELRHLDLQNGWLDYPRPKTSVERRARLWPETVTALTQVLKARKTPKREEHTQLVFVTKYGGPWYAEDNHACPISHAFKKLMREVNADVPGSFYLLRHVFETVAGESRDQVAVDHVMGHVPTGNDMSAVYRESISNERLIAISDTVHAWLFPPPAKPARSQRGGQRNG